MDDFAKLKEYIETRVQRERVFTKIKLVKMDVDHVQQSVPHNINFMKNNGPVHHMKTKDKTNGILTQLEDGMGKAEKVRKEPRRKDQREENQGSYAEDVVAKVIPRECAERAREVHPP